MMNWPALIGLLLKKREAVQAADSFGMYSYGLPRLALAEHLVDELEEVMGRLPEDYRGFLQACNGWPDMLATFHMFGRNELLGGGLAEVASQRLDDWSGLLHRNGVSTRGLDAIGASDFSTDVFCLTKDGGVLWIENGEVLERYSCFKDFFESQIAGIELLTEEVSQHTAQLLREGHKPG